MNIVFATNNEGKLREVNFLRRIRQLRGVGAEPPIDSKHLVWTPKDIIASLRPREFKKEIKAMKTAMKEFSDDLKEHIDDWKQKHGAVEKLIEYVDLYLDFWKWLEKEAQEYPDNWQKNCEFPWAMPFSWNRKFGRHTILDILKEIDAKVIHARKELRREYKVEL